MDFPDLFKDVYVFTHDQELSQQFVLLRTCTKRGARKLQRPGRYYRVSVNGSVGIKRTWFDAVKRVRGIMQNENFFGSVVVMRAYGSDDSFLDQVRFRTLRKVAYQPDPDERLSRGVANFMGYVKVAFPKARFAGACVCKPDSDHARCAACDYFDTQEHMEQMRAADFYYQEVFDPKYGILNQVIAFPEGEHGFRLEPHGGEYHAHYHKSSNEAGASAC